MLAALLAIAAPNPTQPVRAERSRSTASGAGASTSLSTNGEKREQAPETALDAERAFAADAQTLGQWSAFRTWAAPDATMFVPQPINAQTWLKERKDPPGAIAWWPTASYVSCDGSLAVNTGGWKAADGSVGYFSTVWRRQQGGGWRWIVDGGDDLAVSRARPMKPVVVRAVCSSGGRQKGFFADADTIGGGLSADRSLRWSWEILADGTRTMSASLWTGRGYKQVLSDRIAPAR